MALLPMRCIPVGGKSYVLGHNGENRTVQRCHALRCSIITHCLDLNISASETPSEIQSKVLTTAVEKAMGTRPNAPDKTSAWRIAVQPPIAPRETSAIQGLFPF